MKIPPNNTNPAGVRTFDHRKLTELREYEQASRAIDDLAEAITRAQVEMPHEEWLGTGARRDERRRRLSFLPLPKPDRRPK